jgi:hypothetical protein
MNYLQVVQVIVRTPGGQYWIGADTPCAQRVRGLPAKTCLISCPWLHLLKGWSLLNSLDDSFLSATIPIATGIRSPTIKSSCITSILWGGRGGSCLLSRSRTSCSTSFSAAEKSIRPESRRISRCNKFVESRAFENVPKCESLQEPLLNFSCDRDIYKSSLNLPHYK